MNAPPPCVFDAARSLDAVAIIRDHGPLPGVARVEGDTAPWSAPGQQRTITSQDGTVLRETLIRYEPPRAYAYRIGNIEGALARLAAGGESEWRVAPVADGCELFWTYTLTPKSALAAPALWIFLRALWPGYMDAALHRLKALIEAAS